MNVIIRVVFNDDHAVAQLHRAAGCTNAGKTAADDDHVGALRRHKLGRLGRFFAPFEHAQVFRQPKRIAELVGFKLQAGLRRFGLYDQRLIHAVLRRLLDRILGIRGRRAGHNVHALRIQNQLRHLLCGLAANARRFAGSIHNHFRDFALREGHRHLHVALIAFGCRGIRTRNIKGLFFFFRHSRNADNARGSNADGACHRLFQKIASG